MFDHTSNYEIIRSKRKTVSLAVEPDGKLVVRAPLRIPLSYIKEIVENKRNWIEKKQQLAKIQSSVYKEKEFIEGESFLYVGKEYKFHVVTGRDFIYLEDDMLCVPIKFIENAEQHVKEWYIKQAAGIISERVKLYSSLAGIKYKSVKVTNARRRWGSCSSKDSLNFTWRLVMAPVEAIDYVAVHELAHVRQKNHSRYFWEEVEKIMPGYNKGRKWLRQNQKLLDLM
ncbi:MAG: SprT family zinc-dependent metalloprotease [Bacillota bacterium]|nr:SprT family zinc-dependent metalloprotease [Bacillota bacterium]